MSNKSINLIKKLKNTDTSKINNPRKTKKRQNKIN
jgi:hypothetical protein